jgi:uncharacterized protein (TIGR00299 family) protein
VKVLYFDCSSGASGDMIVGALIDAGVSIDEVRHALGSLSIDEDMVSLERVSRAGVRATRFCVRGEDTHGHAHAHRTLREIDELIEGSALSADGKRRAQSLFARLGAVEGSIHGTAPDQVHLHEVGALDSIVDIVSAVHALETLGADRVIASPLNVGSGTIQTAHGLLPVPAPATLALLQGVPIYAGPQQAEMVTPTGALLITEYATAFGPLPPMRTVAVGHGAGTRDLRVAPNVLRAIVGAADEAAPDTQTHDVVVIETEIDDMNPQILGRLMDQLFAQGALDVYFTPIHMKKNRPGTLISIVAPPSARERLGALVFRETTTIGLRYREMARECLSRGSETVSTPFGDIRYKVARRNGEILNASPEFDDCARLASEHGRPIKDVQAAATKAWLDLERR